MGFSRRVVNGEIDTTVFVFVVVFIVVQIVTALQLALIFSAAALALARRAAIGFEASPSSSSWSIMSLSSSAPSTPSSSTGSSSSAPSLSPAVAPVLAALAISLPTLLFLLLPPAGLLDLMKDLLLVGEQIGDAGGPSLAWTSIAGSSSPLSSPCAASRPRPSRSCVLTERVCASTWALHDKCRSVNRRQARGMGLGPTFGLVETARHLVLPGIQCTMWFVVYLLEYIPMLPHKKSSPCCR